MNYNPVNPGAGFEGLSGPAVPRGKTLVRFNADPNGAPGWSGFFDWLSKASPNHAALYNYLRVSLPNFVEDSQPYPEAGRHLGYIDRMASHYDPAGVLNGLGEDPATPINWLTTPASAIVSMNPPLAASEGVTDGVSQPTTVSQASILDTIQKAAPAFLSLANDQKILSAQLDRATKGLPPLDLSKYTANTGVQFGLNASTQQTLLMIGGGIAAVFLLSKLLKR